MKCQTKMERKTVEKWLEVAKYYKMFQMTAFSWLPEPQTDS